MQRFYAVMKYVLIGFTLLCCDEDLPPRGDPDNLVSCSIEAYYAGAPNDETVLNNVYRFYVTLRNNYDETLQGYGLFTGSLDIIWEKDPSCRKTVRFDKSMIVDNRRYVYDADQNILTLDPRHDITFFFEWDWTIDNGDTLPWKHFDMVRDNDCPKYWWARGDHRKWPSGYTLPRWSSKNTFQIRANLKVFREFSVSYAPPLRQEIEYENFRKQFCDHWLSQ